MQLITSLDDPRVAPYRNLRERTLRGENLFIAEAALVVRRLIESDYQVQSILATEEHAAGLRPLAGDEVPIYVELPNDAMTTELSKTLSAQFVTVVID